MLHRRQPTSSTSGPPQSASTPSNSTNRNNRPNTNQAFKPLRRESVTLYSPSGPSTGELSGSGPGSSTSGGAGFRGAARYPLPSASPGLGLSGPPSTSQSGGGYFPSTSASPSQGYSDAPYSFGAGGGASYGANRRGSRDASNYVDPSAWSNNTFDLGDGGKSEMELKDRVLLVLRNALEMARKGFNDSARLSRSWGMVFSDTELRNLILRSTMVNLMSLLLLSFSPIVLSPALSLSPDAQDRARSVGLWYNILLSWPVFVLCFWINAYWGPDISRRAQTLLHPAYRHQPMSPAPGSSFASTQSSKSSSDPLSWLFMTLQRLVLISDFTVVSRSILLVPRIGRPIAFGYMCIINAYYCFDHTFTSKGWSLDHRVMFMQDRVAYMVGFGLPATFLSSFATPLVNMAIFALIYPFFVIQALLSRPPIPRSSLLPSTPSPISSAPPSPGGPTGRLNVSEPSYGWSSREWTFNVPIFFFAKYALMGLRSIEAALGRRRGLQQGGMRERPGKRLM